MRQRGERIERSFAHLYDTGGMRRTHLRGHTNILKRLLITRLPRASGSGLEEHPPSGWNRHRHLDLLLRHPDRDGLHRGVVDRKKSG
jgi:hypothetical protein